MRELGKAFWFVLIGVLLGAAFGAFNWFEYEEVRMWDPGEFQYWVVGGAVLGAISDFI